MAKLIVNVLLIGLAALLAGCGDGKSPLAPSEEAMKPADDSLVVSTAARSRGCKMVVSDKAGDWKGYPNQPTILGSEHNYGWSINISSVSGQDRGLWSLFVKNPKRVPIHGAIVEIRFDPEEVIIGGAVGGQQLLIDNNGLVEPGLYQIDVWTIGSTKEFIFPFIRIVVSFPPNSSFDIPAKVTLEVVFYDEDGHRIGTQKMACRLYKFKGLPTGIL